jgi:hypothetical protein
VAGRPISWADDPTLEVAIRELAQRAGSPKRESIDVGWSVARSAVKFAHSDEAHSMSAQRRMGGKNNSVHATEPESSLFHISGTRI